MDKEKLDQILACQNRLVVTITSIDEKVDRCVTALHGEPARPENGLTLKVDRLQQTEKRRSKIIWAAVIGTVGLVFKSIWTAVGW